jgi:branched-chain amino acid transport system substrate-binding protein
MDNYKAKFGVDANIQSTAGYSVIQVMGVGLQNAGRDLTADSFVAGLEKIKGWSDFFGSAPIAFSKDSHLATRSAFIAQIKSGRWHTVTDHLSY